MSPPDMVAVRDEASGRWNRQQRDALFDDSQPHSDDFYRVYLAQNFLPPWFFRSGHLAMLEDTLEARLLGVDVPAPLQEVQPAVLTEGQRVQQRSMLRNAHVAGSGIVNPTQVPAGVGHWEWLDLTDRDVAEASGFGSSFEDVTGARGAGALSLNPDRQDVPSVVWYPDRQYFNPDSQPRGPGHWAFLTSGARNSDEMMAALQLGGTSGMSNYPTASQIFRLRQQYRAQPREDLTAEIRLVWIPGEEASDSDEEDPILRPLSPAEESDLFITGNTPRASPSPPEQQPNNHHSVLGPGIHPSDIDPTNGNPGGKTDQTATLCPPRYYTYRIAGRIITLDRARPKPGLHEEHKTYVFTREGWQQHPRHVELDWTSKEAIAALASWRDAINRRHGWPKLRSSPRGVYAEDEKAWLRARVHGYLDAGRNYDIVETYRGFLEAFGGRGERTEAGIASVMLRIKRVWRKRRDLGAEAGVAAGEEVGEEGEGSGAEGEDGSGSDGEEVDEEGQRDQEQDLVDGGDEDMIGVGDDGSEPGGEHSDSDDSEWDPIVED